MRQQVIVIGSGGHAAVVVDALLANGVEVLGLTDADSRRHGREVCGRRVLGDDHALAQYDVRAVSLANGIGSTGDCRARRAIQGQLAASGWTFAGVRHPSSIVSPFANLAADAQVLAGSIVQAGAIVAAGCIVNTGAIIEHDVQLGAFTHVAPGALVCGNASIGAGSHVGAGSVVRQGIRVGDETLIAAGAVVVRDHAGSGVLIGVPAREMRNS